MGAVAVTARLSGNWSRLSGMQILDILSLLLTLNAVVVIALMIYEERDPSTTLAWALTLIVLPGFGLVLYFIFGRNWREIGKRDRVRIEAERLGDEAMAPVYEHWTAEAALALSARSESVRRISQAVRTQCGTAPLPCTELTIFDNGAEKFDTWLRDISAASEHIHLEYFIWEDDELTGRVCDLLAEKVAQGVEVRVMYDWVGSLPYSKAQLRRLKEAGGHVKADAAHWSKLNYRNHRKIAVIDGRIGYTGGMNVGQEYIDGKPRYASWRDTHARFTGPLVTDLQRLFCERWYRIAGHDLFTEKYLPPLEPGEGPLVWSQIVHSGPESELQAVRNAFMLTIASAKHRVRVQSPYFIPDEAIEQALVTQSFAGVDVRFMMTGVPDKRIAWNAAFSYIDELTEAGGHLLQYEAGFFHAKSLTIDGEFGAIGTTNFDIRSFMLHDELSVYFFDPGVAQHLDELFDADEILCVTVDEHLLEKMTRVGRFGNAVARLWSRLL